MSINAVLIDDEKHNLDNVYELLNTYCPQVNVVATALNADVGKSVILQHQPELIFLDIQMPFKSGFDLLQELNDYDMEIIFITAYDQYAIQAIRFAALDYLLKPINIVELQSAVSRAAKKCNLNQQNRQLENLLRLLHHKNNKSEQRIALPALNETRFVKTGDILRCESSNNYTTFFLSNGEELIVSKPIYEFEEILKEHDFIRCHQSHLVNKTFINSWKKDYGDQLLLSNGTLIPISRNKKEFVKLALEAK